MSLGDVATFVETGQQLRARERLESIVDGAVSAGNMKRHATRSHLRMLERVERKMQGGERHSQVESTPQTREQAEAAFAAMGIKVERVKKK